MDKIGSVLPQYPSPQLVGLMILVNPVDFIPYTMVNICDILMKFSE